MQIHTHETLWIRQVLWPTPIMSNLCSNEAPEQNKTMAVSMATEKLVAMVTCDMTDTRGERHAGLRRGGSRTRGENGQQCGAERVCMAGCHGNATETQGERERDRRARESELWLPWSQGSKYPRVLFKDLCRNSLVMITHLHEYDCMSVCVRTHSFERILLSGQNIPKT